MCERLAWMSLTDLGIMEEEKRKIKLPFKFVGIIGLAKNFEMFTTDFLC